MYGLVQLDTKMELPRPLREVRHRFLRIFFFFFTKLKGILDMSNFTLTDRNIYSGIEISIPEGEYPVFRECKS